MMDQTPLARLLQAAREAQQAQDAATRAAADTAAKVAQSKQNAKP